MIIDPDLGKTHFMEGAVATKNRCVHQFLIPDLMITAPVDE